MIKMKMRYKYQIDLGRSRFIRLDFLKIMVK